MRKRFDYNLFTNEKLYCKWDSGNVEISFDLFRFSGITKIRNIDNKILKLCLNRKDLLNQIMNYLIEHEPDEETKKVDRDRYDKVLKYIICEIVKAN